MKTNFTKKEIISKELNINNSFYENDKYIGLILADSKELYSTVKFLKDSEKLVYDQLIDITAIDYPSRQFRFDVVYLLLSMKYNERILIKTSINVDQEIESISPLYKAANWYERECYDLFGIKFVNHPDLRRIMTDYNFEGHPLRKDFPLTGHNEVRYDDLEQKVVYDKVHLTQEFRDFDYSSPWEGFENSIIDDEKSDTES